jgi:hypothetical protein
MGAVCATPMRGWIASSAPGWHVTQVVDAVLPGAWHAAQPIAPVLPCTAETSARWHIAVTQVPGAAVCATAATAWTSLVVPG